MSGYHIDWNSRTKSIATVSNIKETKSKIQQNKNTSKKNIFESPKAVTQKNNSGISESKNKIAVQQNSSIGKIFFPRLIKPFTLFQDSLKTNPKKINSTQNNEVNDPSSATTYGFFSLILSILCSYLLLEALNSTFIGLIELVIIPLCIMVLIFSALAIGKAKQINRNPQSKYKSDANAGNTLSLLSIGLILCVASYMSVIGGSLVFVLPLIVAIIYVAIIYL